MYGQELDEEAVRLATDNAVLNHLQDRATFQAGPVENGVWQTIKPDVTIVDPPRSGLHPSTLDQLVKNPSPVLIYVSCQYLRLAQELHQFKTVYRVDRLTALDLFPQTPHVEVVARLVRL